MGRARDRAASDNGPLSYGDVREGLRWPRATAVGSATSAVARTGARRRYVTRMVTAAFLRERNGLRRTVIGLEHDLHAASTWCNQNREETAQIVARHFKLDLPTVKETIDPINWTVAYTPKFRSDMERMSEFLKLKLDWDRMFDARALKAVDPTLAS